MDIQKFDKDLTKKQNINTALTEAYKDCAEPCVNSVNLDKKLISQQELVEKIKQAKDAMNFNEIIKGAKLGLTAYLKPAAGIPASHLVKELQKLIAQVQEHLKNSEGAALIPHINIDLTLSTTSDNAIANSAVTKKINLVESKIPTKLSELASDSTHLTVTQEEKTLWNKKSSPVTVDSALSTTSTNPVLNDIITKKLNTKQDVIEDLDAIRKGASDGQFAKELFINGISKEFLDERIQNYLVLAKTAVQPAELNNYYNKTLIEDKLELKVDKITGKGLSTNDYTNAEKTKLASLNNYNDVQIRNQLEQLQLKVQQIESNPSEGTVTIEDSCTSQSTTAALSARLGYLLLQNKQPRIDDLSLIRQKAYNAYVKPTTGIPKSDLSLEILELLESTPGSLTPSQGSTEGPLNQNIVYVDKAYYRANKAGGNVFKTSNKHYIVIEDLTSENWNVNLTFGENCTLSVLKGCMFPLGNMSGNTALTFTNTYINVGELQIFSMGWAHYGKNFNVGGHIANRRILPEWWGAKQGKVKNGVLVNDLETERRGYINSKAINEAIYMAKENEVYLGGKEYVIGSTIYDYGDKSRSESAGNKYNGNRTRIYIEGNLEATDNFIGVRYKSKNGVYKTKKGGPYSTNTPWTHFPTMIYATESAMEITIKGSLIIPHSALDKEIVICKFASDGTTLLDANNNVITPKRGPLYFVCQGLLEAADDSQVNYVAKVYEYMDRLWLGKDIENDQPSYYTLNIPTSGLFPFGVYVTSRYTIKQFREGTYRGKLPGMYGIYIAGMAQKIDIAKIVKGDDRIGYWKRIYNGNSPLGVGSYRYLRDVMHQGHCTAVLMGTALSSMIKIGLIEGFNNGIAFERFYTDEYCMTLFNHFDLNGIGANYAIHINIGEKLAMCLLAPHKLMVATKKSTNGGSDYYYYLKFIPTQEYVDSLGQEDGYFWYIMSVDKPSGVYTANGQEYYQLPGGTTSTYFDGCKWIINGGSEAFWAGNSGLSSVFSPTVASSTYLLVEGTSSETRGWAGDWDYCYARKGSFSNHWLVFDNAPLRSYAVLFDLAGARDNKFDLHGNTFGDTGRLTLWTTPIVGEDNVYRAAGTTIIIDSNNPKDIGANARCALNTFVGISGLSGNPYSWTYYASKIGSGVAVDTVKEDYYSNTPRSIKVNDILISAYNAPYTIKGDESIETVEAKYDTNDMPEWKFPYSAEKLYINFRTNSSFNIINAGKGHLTCFDAVYSDNTCERNELKQCQSFSAIYFSGDYNDNVGWTLFNGRHPLFQSVQYNTSATPKGYATESVSSSTPTIRVMYPDSYTMSSIRYIDVPSISNSELDKLKPGLYLNIGEKILSTSPVHKVYLYKLYDIYRLRLYINSASSPYAGEYLAEYRYYNIKETPGYMLLPNIPTDNCDLQCQPSIVTSVSEQFTTLHIYNDPLDKVLEACNVVSSDTDVVIVQRNNSNKWQFKPISNGHATITITLNASTSNPLVTAPSVTTTIYVTPITGINITNDFSNVRKNDTVTLNVVDSAGNDITNNCEFSVNSTSYVAIEDGVATMKSTVTGSARAIIKASYTDPNSGYKFTTKVKFTIKSSGS